MAFGMSGGKSEIKKLSTPAKSVSKKTQPGGVAGLSPTQATKTAPPYFNQGNLAAANSGLTPYLQIHANQASLPTAPIAQSSGPTDPRAMGGSPLTGGYVDPSTYSTAGGSGSVNMTGYGKQFGYTPESLDEIINQHPEILSGDVLRGMGIRSTGLAGQLGDEAGVAQLVATILASQQGNALNNNDTLNQIGAYFKNRVTPGGGSPDASALINDILNAGASSPLYNELGLGSASGQSADQQAGGVNKAIYGVMNDQNGYTQQATKNYLAQLQSDYARMLATNPAAAGTTYQDYLKGHSALQGWFA
jgi:hypothetical protein